MWVVKIGGSLADDPMLADWLEQLNDLGGGRVVIVPGGGGFADAARRSQTTWHLDDLVAHNMAILGMGQFAFMLHGLHAELELCANEGDIIATMRRGRIAVWMPLGLLRDKHDELTTWEVTSDSLALWLAGRLNAERTVIIKSCPIPDFAAWQDLADEGIVDQRFPSFAERASSLVMLLERTDLAVMRAMLLDARDTPCTNL